MPMLAGTLSTVVNEPRRSGATQYTRHFYPAAEKAFLMEVRCAKGNRRIFSHPPAARGYALGYQILLFFHWIYAAVG
jgi:hypothetical protein